MQRALVVMRDARLRTGRLGLAQEGQARIAQHLDVAHHVRVAHGHEALGAEETPDLDLVGDGAAHAFALGAVQHAAFLLAQLHRVSPCGEG